MAQSMPTSSTKDSINIPIPVPANHYKCKNGQLINLQDFIFKLNKMDYKYQDKVKDRIAKMIISALKDLANDNSNITIRKQLQIRGAIKYKCIAYVFYWRAHRADNLSH
jgi:hypothetical protein